LHERRCLPSVADVSRETTGVNARRLDAGEADRRREEGARAAEASAPRRAGERRMLTRRCACLGCVRSAIRTAPFCQSHLDELPDNLRRALAPPADGGAADVAAATLARARAFFAARAA